MVYILNNMTHDYSKAEKFGELVNVTEGKVPIFRTETMLNILNEALKDFTQDDFLLISGPAIVCMMAYHMLKSRLKSIRVLVFDAKEQDYIIRHM